MKAVRKLCCYLPPADTFMSAFFIFVYLSNMLKVFLLQSNHISISADTQSAITAPLLVQHNTGKLVRF